MEEKEISSEEQQMAEKKSADEKELKISTDLYTQYRNSSRGAWAARCASDRAFKFNAMWSESDQKANDERGQISPTPNELIPTLGLVVAQLTENQPRFYAIGSERSDIKTASAIADLMAYIWYISEGDDHNKQVATDFEDIGMGCWVPYIDPFADNGNGEIKIINEDPLDIYLSPASRCPFGTDATNILIVKHFEEDTLKVMYPQLDLENIAAIEDSNVPTHDRHTHEDQTIGQQTDGTGKKRYRIIDRYTKVKVKRFHVVDPRSDFEGIMTQDDYIKFAEEPAVALTQLGKTTYYIKPNDVEFYFNIIRTYGNIYHMVMNPDTREPELASGVENPMNPLIIPNSTRKLEVFSKGDLLRQGILKYNTPFVDRVKRVFTVGNKVVANYLIENDKGALTTIPIILVMLHHSRNPYPMGDIALVKTLQEMLCKIDNLILTYNQNITNVKLFVQKGGGLKKDLDKSGGDAGFHVYEMDMDVDRVPFIVQLTQMSSSFYQQRQNLVLQIQRTIGAYSFQDGDATQAPQTAGGTYQVDEMMQRRTASKRRVLESGLNKVGKVISEMIPLVYDQRKIFKIAKPNHKETEVSINNPQYDENGELLQVINDVISTKFDIRVISGSMSPINRVQRREQKLREYEIGILKNPKWYIRDMDYPDVDEIIEGEDALNQAQQLIQQLQEEIKKLQGDAQTQQREIVNMGKRVEVEKFKSELNNVSSDLKANANLSKMRMQDATKESKKDKVNV